MIILFYRNLTPDNTSLQQQTHDCSHKMSNVWIWMKLSIRPISSHWISGNIIFIPCFLYQKNTPHLCSRTSASLGRETTPTGKWRISSGSPTKSVRVLLTVTGSGSTPRFINLYTVYIYYMYVYIINVISLYINILNSISQGGWWMVDSFSSTSPRLMLLGKWFCSGCLLSMVHFYWEGLSARFKGPCAPWQCSLPNSKKNWCEGFFFPTQFWHHCLLTSKNKNRVKIEKIK